MYICIYIHTYVIYIGVDLRGGGRDNHNTVAAHIVYIYMIHIYIYIYIYLYMINIHIYICVYTYT